ncbi:MULTISPECIES: Mu transposase domain-containing protein [Rhizobium]|uniref:Mu transposase domain-containing protein n=1 Tax=Rhizobium TaxID=379 RepID=UPI0035E430AE
MVRVSTDYHVEFKSFFSSVPHALIRQQVDLRATARTIEIFYRGKRIAVHQRRYGGCRHGADPDHMPSSHRRYAEWTPDRFRRWAASIGQSMPRGFLRCIPPRSPAVRHARACKG